MPKRLDPHAGGRSARRAGSAAKRPSRRDLLALTDAITRVLEQFYPDLSEEDVRRMVRETSPISRSMTDDEIAATGTRIKAEDARPKRGRRRGRAPGPWVAVALGLGPSEARVWRNILEDQAKTAQSNVTSKRRRDGKDERGRWRTPIWVNIAREPAGTYRVIVANDPDREAHEAME